MKILMYVQTLAHGGAERVASEIANGLSKLGHDLYVLTDTTVPVQYKLEENIKIIEVQHNRLFGHILKRFCILQARRVMKEIQPDIAIGIMRNEALTLLLASKTIRIRIPVVFSDHDSFEKPFKLSLWRKFIKSKLSRWCGWYTVLTQEDLKCATKVGLTRVSTMYNPLSIRPIDTVPEKEKTILAVGRLDDWYYKGFDNLIKAWGKIAAKYPEWTLQIAGAGNDNTVNFLGNLIKEYCNPEKISLIGHFSDLVPIYRRSSVFVLSSRYEGFGLVLIEAMSQRCACIACDYKGRQKEIVTDGINGIICDPDNVDMLAEKMDQVLSDEKFRKKLQHSSCEDLDKFLPQQVALAWDRLLKRIMGGNIL